MDKPGPDNRCSTTGASHRTKVIWPLILATIISQFKHTCRLIFSYTQYIIQRLTFSSSSDKFMSFLLLPFRPPKLNLSSASFTKSIWEGIHYSVSFFLSSQCKILAMPTNFELSTQACVAMQLQFHTIIIVPMIIIKIAYGQ